jgi:hypothetical protein
MPPKRSIPGRSRFGKIRLESNEEFLEAIQGLGLNQE